MRCDSCPVAPSSPCLGESSGGVCARAAREGEGAFRVSLVRRAKMLAGAVGRFVASGGERATPDERARRLAICGGCEHFDAGGRRCRLCTCYMPLKARLATEHCPVEKW